MRQFEYVSADVEGTENLNVDYIIRSLAQYFPPVNSMSKQKCNVPWNEKTRSLTVRHYATRLIDLHEYLESFMGATLTVKC